MAEMCPSLKAILALSCLLLSIFTPGCAADQLCENRTVSLAVTPSMIKNLWQPPTSDRTSCIKWTAQLPTQPLALKAGVAHWIVVELQQPMLLNGLSMQNPDTGEWQPLEAFGASRLPVETLMQNQDPCNTSWTSMRNIDSVGGWKSIVDSGVAVDRAPMSVILINSTDYLAWTALHLNGRWPVLRRLPGRHRRQWQPHYDKPWKIIIKSCLPSHFKVTCQVKSITGRVQNGTEIVSPSNVTHEIGFGMESTHHGGSLTCSLQGFQHCQIEETLELFMPPRYSDLLVPEVWIAGRSLTFSYKSFESYPKPRHECWLVGPTVSLFLPVQSETVHITKTDRNHWLYSADSSFNLTVESRMSGAKLHCQSAWFGRWRETAAYKWQLVAGISEPCSTSLQLEPNQRWLVGETRKFMVISGSCTVWPVRHTCWLEAQHGGGRSEQLVSIEENSFTSIHKLIVREWMSRCGGWSVRCQIDQSGVEYSDVSTPDNQLPAVFVSIVVKPQQLHRLWQPSAVGTVCVDWLAKEWPISEPISMLAGPPWLALQLNRPMLIDRVSVKMGSNGTSRTIRVIAAARVPAKLLQQSYCNATWSALDTQTDGVWRPVLGDVGATVEQTPDSVILLNGTDQLEFDELNITGRWPTVELQSNDSRKYLIAGNDWEFSIKNSCGLTSNATCYLRDATGQQLEIYRHESDIAEQFKFPNVSKKLDGGSLTCCVQGFKNCPIHSALEVDEACKTLISLDRRSYWTPGQSKQIRLTFTKCQYRPSNHTCWLIDSVGRETKELSKIQQSYSLSLHSLTVEQWMAERDWWIDCKEFGSDSTMRDVKTALDELPVVLCNTDTGLNASAVWVAGHPATVTTPAISINSIGKSRCWIASSAGRLDDADEILDVRTYPAGHWTSALSRQVRLQFQLIARLDMRGRHILCKLRSSGVANDSASSSGGCIGNLKIDIDRVSPPCQTQLDIQKHPPWRLDEKKRIRVTSSNCSIWPISHTCWLVHSNGKVAERLEIIQQSFSSSLHSLTVSGQMAWGDWLIRCRTNQSGVRYEDVETQKDSQPIVLSQSDASVLQSALHSSGLRFSIGVTRGNPPVSNVTCELTAIDSKRFDATFQAESVDATKSIWKFSKPLLGSGVEKVCITCSAQQYLNGNLLIYHRNIGFTVSRGYNFTSTGHLCCVDPAVTPAVIKSASFGSGIVACLATVALLCLLALITLSVASVILFKKLRHQDVDGEQLLRNGSNREAEDNDVLLPPVAEYLQDPGQASAQQATGQVVGSTPGGKRALEDTSV